MSERRRLWTALGALSLAAFGAFGGAAGTAWQARELRAKPWSKLRLEQRGKAGVTMHTRVDFANAKLPLASIEIVASPGGKPESAHVQLPSGIELMVRYGRGARPTGLEGPDGAAARLSYKGSDAQVALFAADGRPVGEAVVRVPMALRAPLRQARTGGSRDHALAKLWQQVMAGSLITQAQAQEAQQAEKDQKVTVVRELALALEVDVKGGQTAAAGSGQLEVSCPPFSCLAVQSAVAIPGHTSTRISVTGSLERGALPEPTKKALDKFKAEASKERVSGQRSLPRVAAIVASVALVALVCKSYGLDWAVCVPALDKQAAGAAIHGISSHRVATTGPLVSERARELYYEDQARAALDTATKVQACVSRAGYLRTCTTIEGRPFGATPMPEAARRVAMRRGIGSTMTGSFTLWQADGADCKFSPSPKTDGKLSLSFDSKRGVLSAKLQANQRGVRPGLSCSLGVGTMSWSQGYTISVKQAISQERLDAGGTLKLRLIGTMVGSSSYRWSNCRSASGASGACPGGRSDSYSYPAELLGSLDLDSQMGKGRIMVAGAPLSTGGNWSVGSGGKP